MSSLIMVTVWKRPILLLGLAILWFLVWLCKLTSIPISDPSGYMAFVLVHEFKVKEAALDGFIDRRAFCITPFNGVLGFSNRYVLCFKESPEAISTISTSHSVRPLAEGEQEFLSSDLAKLPYEFHLNVHEEVVYKPVPGYNMFYFPAQHQYVICTD